MTPIFIFVLASLAICVLGAFVAVAIVYISRQFALNRELMLGGAVALGALLMPVGERLGSRWVAGVGLVLMSPLLLMF